MISFKLGLTRSVLKHIHSSEKLNISANLAKAFITLDYSTRRFSTSPIQPTSKICIIGSGPAAMYTAQYILKSHPDIKKSIDIYEKLPVPFGLVRYGVAPDHQDVKKVINSFTDTLKNENVNFFGNIAIGDDLKISELTAAYNCVVLAYGSHSENYLNIPGEKSFSNLISAKDFVSWYNGLPGSGGFKADLGGKNAVIIGAGNVALDIARILLSPVDKLSGTDISVEAIDIIKRTNQIDNVTIVARRGILNAAFTIKELRELSKINSLNFKICLNEELNEIEVLKKLSRPRKRLTEFMLKTANSEQIDGNKKKTLNVVFLRTPLEILGNEKGITGVKFQKNQSKTDISADLSNEEVLNSFPCVPLDTGESEIIPADLVVRSIGFKNINIDKDIPFDKKNGVILNDDGKIIGRDGLYCTGWIKRGPRGVIVDTTTDANQTAKKLCQDLQTDHSEQIQSIKGGSDEICKLLKERGIQYVDKHGWKRIDEEEIRRGQLIGKPRDKLQKIEEMLKVANG